MAKLPVIKNRLHKDEIDKIPSKIDDRRSKRKTPLLNGIILP